MEGQFPPPAAAAEDGGAIPAARVPKFLRVSFVSKQHEKESVLIKLADPGVFGDRIDISPDAGRGGIPADEVLSQMIITEQFMETKLTQWQEAIFTRIKPSHIQVDVTFSANSLFGVELDAEGNIHAKGLVQLPTEIAYNQEVRWFIGKSFPKQLAAPVSDPELKTYFEQFGAIGLSVDEDCFHVEPPPAQSRRRAPRGGARQKKEPAPRVEEEAAKRPQDSKKRKAATTVSPKAVVVEEDEEMEGGKPEDISDEDETAGTPGAAQGKRAKRKDDDDRDKIIEEQRLKIKKLREDLRKECERKSKYFQAQKALSRELKTIRCRRREIEQYVVTQTFRRNYLHMMVFFANILQKENDFMGFIQQHIQGTMNDGSNSFLQVFIKGKRDGEITTLEEFRKHWNEIGERVFKDVRGAEEFISLLKQHIQACPDDGNGPLLKLIKLYQPDRSRGYLKFLFAWSMLGNLAFGDVETIESLATPVDAVRSHVREILSGKGFRPEQLLTRWEYEKYKSGDLPFPKSAGAQRVVDTPKEPVSHSMNIFAHLKFDFSKISEDFLCNHLDYLLDKDNEMEGSDPNDSHREDPPVPGQIDDDELRVICGEIGLDFSAFTSLRSNIPIFFDSIPSSSSSAEASGACGGPAS